jgi:primosomal protein N' (replication factor Y)
VRAVEPTRAAERAARPLIELVEPARERVLSAALHRGISQTLAAGGRVALLAPRRGFARVLWCASCRRSLRCARCEAAVAYDAPRRDRGQGRVRCVRCGLSESAPSSCPVCGAAAWRYLGAGSERLERQVARAWPRATVARVDPDAPERDEGEPDIYVTTWLGTKPELRPPVTFVAVLDADVLIRRPDFRAAENAYHALAAMAEWAGPASAGGRLAIQCTEPAHHAVQAVVRADHHFFVRRELELRAELGYPPFSELIEMRAAGPEAADTMARAVDVSRRAGARVVGPVPTAPGARGDLRALAKCEDALPVAEALRDILASAPPGGGLRIDVDPR